MRERETERERGGGEREIERGGEIEIWGGKWKLRDPEKYIFHMSQARVSPFNECRISVISLSKFESVCIRHLNMTPQKVLIIYHIMLDPSKPKICD